jgi:hypothetical protein
VRRSLLARLKACAAAQAARAALAATLSDSSAADSTVNGTSVAALSTSAIGESLLSTTSTSVSVSSSSSSSSDSSDQPQLDTSAALNVAETPSSSTGGSYSSTYTNELSSGAMPFTNTPLAVQFVSAEVQRPARIVELLHCDSDSDTDSIISEDSSVVTDDSELPIHVRVACYILSSFPPY